MSNNSFLLILAGSACIAIGGYALTVFGPAYLMRARGLSLQSVGVQYGVTAGLFGVVGLMLTGFLADRLSARDPRWTLWTVAAMIAVLLPFSATAYVVPNLRVSIAFLALANVIATAYLAPIIAAVQRLTPREQRATASAIVLFFSALFGGTGPLLTGYVSDLLLPTFGSQSLARALLIVPIAHGFAALLYLAASRGFRQHAVFT